MKIYLASFFQPENHGPGRLISISYKKPEQSTVGLFEHFIPAPDIDDTYRREQLEDQAKAATNFISNYKAQLDGFLTLLEGLAKEQNITIPELLPFQDGDTLASWERAEYTNYRKILSEYLIKAGFEVVLN